MPTLTEVEGKVLALMAEHKGSRDGIWILFDEDSDTTNRWYIDFLDESALAVTCELQLLRDALSNNLRTRLWYSEESGSAQRLVHQVRIYAS